MRIVLFHISRFNVSFGFESIVRLFSIVDTADGIMVMETRVPFTHFLNCQIR